MKTLVVIAVLSLTVAGCRTTGRVTESPAERTEAMFSVAPEPDPEAAARELLQQGHTEEVATVLEGVLTRDPGNLSALKLLVSTRRQLAKRYATSARHAAASTNLEKMIRVITSLRGAVLRSAAPDTEWLSETRKLHEEVEAHILYHVSALTAEAQHIRDNALSFWGSDKDMVIDALVVLDAVKGLIRYVPLDARRAWHDLWVDLYHRLGNADRERYKTRTALINGGGDE